MSEGPWPEGKNPILGQFRESWDPGDALSCTSGWLCAIADALITLGMEVPDEWGFRQAMAGPDDEAYEYQAIMGLMIPEEYIYDPLTVEELMRHLEHAGRVINRLDEQLRLAGWSL